MTTYNTYNTYDAFDFIDQVATYGLKDAFAELCEETLLEAINRNDSERVVKVFNAIVASAAAKRYIPLKTADNMYRAGVDIPKVRGHLTAYVLEYIHDAAVRNSLRIPVFDVTEYDMIVMGKDGFQFSDDAIMVLANQHDEISLLSALPAEVKQRLQWANLK